MNVEGRKEGSSQIANEVAGKSSDHLRLPESHRKIPFFSSKDLSFFPNGLSVTEFSLESGDSYSSKHLLCYPYSFYHRIHLTFLGYCEKVNPVINF